MRQFELKTHLGFLRFEYCSFPAGKIKNTLLYHFIINILYPDSTIVVKALDSPSPAAIDAELARAA
jgi:hypothetical protein